MKNRFIRKIEYRNINNELRNQKLEETFDFLFSIYLESNNKKYEKRKRNLSKEGV